MRTKSLLEPVALTIAMVNIALAFAVVLRPPDNSGADFFTFWDSARASVAGLDPYFGIAVRPGMGGNLNPPGVLPLFLPFAFAPLVPAFVAWMTLNIALLAFAAWRAATVTGLSRSLLIVCAMFISQATFSALQLGQLSGVLAVLITEAWIADREARPMHAGVLLGLAIGAKPFLAPLALYAMWRRQGPTLIGIVFGVAAISLAGLAVFGAAGYRSWFEMLRHVTWTAHVGNGSILAALTRLLTPPTLTHLTPIALREAWVTPIWSMLIVLVGALTATAIVRSRNSDAAWAMLITGSLLVSPLGWIYYAPLAIGPLVGSLRDAAAPARLCASVGYVFLCVPYTVMDLPYNASLSVIVGSAGTVGLAAFYFSAMLSSQGETRPATVPVYRGAC